MGYNPQIAVQLKLTLRNKHMDILATEIRDVDVIVPHKIEPVIPPLRECVRMAVERYIEHLEGDEATNLYDMVLEEIEEPLLRTVMKYTNYNQSKTALWLGLSRGTTRKKLEKYELVSEDSAKE